MASMIDVTKPVYGNPTTQSVRDNFNYAYTEITDLQNKTNKAPYLPISGGTMDGFITMQTDPVNPYDVATKRYVDNLAFGDTGGIGEAPIDGMFYARGHVSGGSAWSKNPIFESVFINSDDVTVNLQLGFNASYNFLKFAGTVETYIRYNRSSQAIEVVSANTVIQSWFTTGSIINKDVIINGELKINSNTQPILRFDTSSATNSESILFQLNGLKKWVLSYGGTLNIFGLYCYDATGALLDTPWSVGGGVGNIVIQRNLSIEPIQDIWPGITLKTKTGQQAVINAYRNNNLRWQFALADNIAETGGNIGSNFSINRYNDAGAYIDTPLAIGRSNAEAQFTGLIRTVSGRLISQSAGGNPSVVSYNTTSPGYAAGFVCENTGNLAFGWFDGVGGGFQSRFWYIRSNDTLYVPNYQFGTSVFSNVKTYFGMYYSGTLRYITLNTGRALLHDETTGNCMFDNSYTNSYIRTGGGLEGYIMMQSDKQFSTNAWWTAKPGGGAWADSSDIRGKIVDGEYQSGLKELIQLNPIRYRFKGNIGLIPKPDAKQRAAKDFVKPEPIFHHSEVAKEGRQFIGLSAQDVEKIMPEMIHLKDGVIDGVETNDIRAMDTTPLSFAFINAFKEIHARLTILENK